MPVQVSIDSPTTDYRQRDLRDPNNKETIWPVPHDAKIDIGAVIDTGLKLLGIDDVPVIQDGAFDDSLLTNKHGQSVPVVSIMRTADITAREALGNRIGTFIGGESPLLDPCGIVPDGEPVDLFAEFSVVTLDVTITDFIGYRANQMYLIIKYVMMTAQSVLHKLGYVDLKRLNGVDQVQSIDAPAGGLLHTRTLTYQMKHPDFVASLPTLVELVKQRVETLPVGVSTGPTLGTDI